MSTSEHAHRVAARKALHTHAARAAALTAKRVPHGGDQLGAVERRQRSVVLPTSYKRRERSDRGILHMLVKKPRAVSNRTHNVALTRAGEMSLDQKKRAALRIRQDALGNRAVAIAGGPAWRCGELCTQLRHTHSCEVLRRREIKKRCQKGE